MMQKWGKCLEVLVYLHFIVSFLERSPSCEFRAMLRGRLFQDRLRDSESELNPYRRAGGAAHQACVRTEWLLWIRMRRDLYRDPF